MHDDIELRYELDGTDTRVLRVQVVGGDLHVEGHDEGPGVERYYGAGVRRVRWGAVVSAPDVLRVLEALGGDASSSAIDVIRRTCADDADRLREALWDLGIPVRPGPVIG
jgi:hypothetical protein